MAKIFIFSQFTIYENILEISQLQNLWLFLLKFISCAKLRQVILFRMRCKYA